MTNTIKSTYTNITADSRKNGLISHNQWCYQVTDDKGKTRKLVVSHSLPFIPNMETMIFDVVTNGGNEKVDYGGIWQGNGHQDPKDALKQFLAVSGQ